MTVIRIRLALESSRKGFGLADAYDVVDRALDAGAVQDAIIDQAEVSGVPLVIASAYAEFEEGGSGLRTDDVRAELLTLEPMIRDVIRAAPDIGARAALRLVLARMIRLRGRLGASDVIAAPAAAGASS